MDDTNTNANPIVDTTVDTNSQEPVVEQAPAQTPEVAEAMPAVEATVAPEASVEEKPAEEPAQA